MTNINWHRLFGLTLMDLFTDSNYAVELEKELSIKKQYLDVVIIKKTIGKPLEEIPAGLENLTEHNLLTYKSLREPLDDWAIEELICHYANYRKLISPVEQLLPQDQFQLYAISTRYPHKLLNQEINFQEIETGVIDLKWGTRLIRLIILSRIPTVKKNALWLLFSGKGEEFVYGNQHYQWCRLSEKAVLNQLYELYQAQEVIMPYTIEDFNRDFTREHLHLLPPEERLKGLPPEERLKGLPPEERLKGLPPESIFEQFSPEERLKGLPPESIFERFPPEVIEEYLSKLKGK
jgi:hypothetical protein